MQHFLVLGRQPLLALAEAKAVIDGEKPVLAGNLAIFSTIQWDGLALQNRLAGTVKLGDIIAEMDVKSMTPELLVHELEARPRGVRINFGLSVYGGSVGSKDKTKSLAIKLKRILQERGHAVRWVTGEQGEISPAAVNKMHLTTEGYDLVIGIVGPHAFVGLTTAVQNADTWSERDYGRPFRDTQTGMLPPKLARLMVNLGLKTRNMKRETSDTSSFTLLDPFCGGGTILMEAALLDVRSIIGADFDTRQITGVKTNLDWLTEKRIISKDVRNNIKLLTQPIQTLDHHLKSDSIDAIVTEGFLGKPLNGYETKEFLEKQKHEIEELWRKTLTVSSKLLKRGGKLVGVWPVFKTRYGTVAVDLKDELSAAGFTQTDPLADWKDKPVTLTYSREGQHVLRNIVVLEKRLYDAPNM